MKASWRHGALRPQDEAESVAAQRPLESSPDYAWLMAVVNGAIDGVITIDEAGVIQSFNRAAAALFGYDPAEAIGQNVRMLMPEPYRSRHDGFLSHYLQTGEAKIIGVGREVEGRRKDGSVFPIELGVTAVEAAGKRFFVGFIHDLSERRRNETRMRELHADRLKLIENMAGGLAHELNQPLSAIGSYLNVARRLLKKERELAKIDEILNNAAGQVMRAAEIISNLREFIAHGEPSKTLQRLNDVVRTACEFTDAMAKEHKVKTTVRLDAENDRVIVNRVQIQQVVVNLKRNAIEAMQGCERREMAVSTSLVEGNMIRTDVADTGPGLSDAIKNKLFEPFTTTKPHGLGVGLSISRSIIEAHRGKLWAEPNPGGGTIFSFVLPLADSENGAPR
jgi:two-component system sensor kinase FixL